jgi:hypothetical protein
VGGYVYPVKVGDWVGLVVGVDVVGLSVGDAVGVIVPHRIWTAYALLLGVRQITNPAAVIVPSLRQLMLVPDVTGTF